MRRLFLAFAVIVAFASHAWAQPLPARPVKIVVPFAPGGAVDSVARIVGQQLAEQLGQPVVVENKPGGNANIGAQFVAMAPPDGYTMLLGANGLATNPALDKNPSFDPLKDFRGVAMVGYAPLVLLVPADSPAKTVQELVALSKAKPGTLNYGSSAVGGSGHLAVELLKLKTGIDAQHIAYKGGAPALTDLIGGRIAFMMVNPLEAAPHTRSGRVRALAVSSAGRIPSMPDVPTFEEAGVKGYEASVWWGFVVPAATPAAVVTRLSNEALKALQNPSVRSRLEAMGAVIEPLPADDFTRFLHDETRKWAEVIKAAGIRAD